MLDSKSIPSPSRIIYPQRELINEVGVSRCTWWRWTKNQVIPAPDVEINKKLYYSASRRDEVIKSILGYRVGASKPPSFQ